MSNFNSEYNKARMVKRTYDSGVLTHKQCSRCKEVREVQEFHRDKSLKDGHHNECKLCAKIRWDANVDRKRLSFILTRVKSKAKKDNLPFDLTLADLIVPTHCPVLGIRMEFGKTNDNKNWRDNSPSVDRIIPELGYVKNNIIVISYRANRIKNDATLEEL